MDESGGRIPARAGGRLIGVRRLFSQFGGRGRVEDGLPPGLEKAREKGILGRANPRPRDEYAARENPHAAKRGDTPLG